MAENKEIKTARYVSRYAQLRLVLKPAYTSELHGRVVTHPGEDVRFEGGVYETKDPSIIEQLESRNEFGSIFIRVPDDTDSAVHKTEWLKDLETRKKELEDKEAELAKREAKLKEAETGRTVSNKKEDEDDLDGLKREELVKIAKEVGLEAEDYKVGVKNADIIAKIRKAKAVKEGKQEGAPAY